jgi:predicted  nucleic acid-binding Zn-ribbon protein
MDQELIAYLDERFRQTAEQIGSLRQETAQRFESMESAIRQTHVVVEGLRGDIQLLAEGIIGMEEKLQSLRDEVSQQFDEVRKSVEVPFKHLDRRVSALESRAALETRDPLDVIRERYGRKTT